MAIPMSSILDNLKLSFLNAKREREDDEYDEDVDALDHHVEQRKKKARTTTSIAAMMPRPATAAEVVLDVRSSGASPVALHTHSCSSSSTKSRAGIEADGTDILTGGTTENENRRPPIITVGCDVMAHILTFLEPPLILEILTMPFSKGWQQNFTSQSELWRVLCLVEPFKATFHDHDADVANSSLASASTTATATATGVVVAKSENKRLLDKYRLLYTSFVRCMKYISQIKDDAVHGRSPAYIDYGTASASGSAGGTSTSAATMNAIATAIATSSGNAGASASASAGNNGNNRTLSLPSPPTPPPLPTTLKLPPPPTASLKLPNENNTNNDTKGPPRLTTPARVATAVRKNTNTTKKHPLPKLGRSMITGRLFGPTSVKNRNLPWSFAIYSIVNWMVAYSDVEGIQTLCLRVLPTLLENEQHRLVAQNAGLADVVLRAMVIFSSRSSMQLHLAAFHAIVLLARPHGGKEGMLFHQSMTLKDGIFGRRTGGGIHHHPHHKLAQHAMMKHATKYGNHNNGTSAGMAVMLDSMKRFQDDAALSSMSCWALVNIALVSDQKAILVKLGGIEAIVNAMGRHPSSAELQFRALFALINLVIPSTENKNGADNTNNANGNGAVPAPAVAVAPAPLVPAARRQIRGGRPPPPPGAGGEDQEEDDQEEQQEQDHQLGDLNETTEKEVIDELVTEIASLVVRAMKNFCSSEAIVNRACLVLNNLSLTEEYHVVLLWTPQCYQMLEWCIANYRTDQVLQQSATGTLHRLQSTLSSNKEMREKFSQSLRTQSARVREQAQQHTAQQQQLKSNHNNSSSIVVQPQQ